MTPEEWTNYKKQQGKLPAIRGITVCPCGAFRCSPGYCFELVAMDMTVGSRIRISRQPPNQWQHLVGEVGLIVEMPEEKARMVQDTHCSVRTFTKDGCGGSGTLPLWCLEPYSSPELEEQIAEWEARVIQLRDRIEDQNAAS